MAGKQTVIEPDLDDVLESLKNEIFAGLNCCQIGRIEAVTVNDPGAAGEYIASIQLQAKRRINETEVRSYPLLTDCPIIVMQGGGAFLEFPVKVGDFCLVFFNDRNINTWWDAGIEAEPADRRKHSISDGFALVGVNPKTSALDLSGDRVKLNTGDMDIDIEAGSGTVNIISSGECNINCNSVNLGGDAALTEEVLKGSAFLGELLTAFNAHTHNFAGTGSVLTPTTPWVPVTFPNSKSANVKTS